ncbi:hypothetical protein [Solidesulfovibrio sp.]|jgi:hypothetical protein|uniref:hypothetical protein n=1 Tax=Solidesulfovibrio sp. TaxID=2910990 RepID=UPI000EC6F7F4|nr:hypothetical protein [Solidesulfovibrio sp.]MEA5089199.1 hypothetical protein [Solidesulfovibrio sp.]HCR13474.1 hypothetical protein [Desulfovibrio sp.]HML60375.1 hypothetical protein [Solidesulfovibrio sp.]
MDITTSYDSLNRQLTITQGATAGIATGSASGNTTTSDTSSSSKADAATWSRVAKTLSQSDSDYVSPILSLKSQNEALQHQLTQTLASKFDELGIDTSKPITLKLGSDGKVKVANDHPDKDAIESLFAKTDVLTQAFTALAQNSASLQNMTASQASARLRTNGYAAYLNQLNSDVSSSDFTMSFLGGLAATSFG